MQRIYGPWLFFLVGFALLAVAGAFSIAMTGGI
jgi:hypothetical protein